MELQKWLEKVEIMWRQRSRALWLKEGDLNTKYFHRRASHRQKKNVTKRVKDREGCWQVKEDRDHIILNYFTGMFTTSSQRVSLDFLDG